MEDADEADAPLGSVSRCQEAARSKCAFGIDPTASLHLAPLAAGGAGCFPASPYGRGAGRTMPTTNGMPGQPGDYATARFGFGRYPDGDSSAVFSTQDPGTDLRIAIIGAHGRCDSMGSWSGAILEEATAASVATGHFQVATQRDTLVGVQVGHDARTVTLGKKVPGTVGHDTGLGRHDGRECGRVRVSRCPRGGSIGHGFHYHVGFSSNPPARRHAPPAGLGAQLTLQ